MLTVLFKLRKISNELLWWRKMLTKWNNGELKIWVSVYFNLFYLIIKFRSKPLKLNFVPKFQLTILSKSWREKINVSSSQIGNHFSPLGEKSFFFENSFPIFIVSNNKKLKNYFPKKLFSTQPNTTLILISFFQTQVFSFSFLFFFRSEGAQPPNPQWLRHLFLAF